MELVLFGDVESAVVKALNAEFATRMPGVKWSTRKPSTVPAAGFGRVLRTGGPRESLVSENASITLEGWHPDETTALGILNLGRAILNAQDGPLFGVTEYGGPINLPEPGTSQVRFTAMFGVRARGTVTA